jgi:hypothetical protein
MSIGPGGGQQGTGRYAACHLVVWVAGLMACERELPPTGGPTLVLHDRVVLQEDESLYVARPTFLVPDRDGGYYVGDLFLNRVVRFDRTGVPIRAYGGQGDGPGEMRAVGLPIVLDDSTVAVADQGRQRLSLYDQESGAFRGTVPVSGIIRSAVSGGDSVWLGDLDADRRTTVALWDRQSDSVTYLGRMPTEYVESSPLRGIFNASHIEVWGDTILVGLAGSSRLDLLRLDGTPLDSVTVPARERRGVPSDVVRRLSPGVPFPEMFSLLSGLFAVRRRSDGTVALVHGDGRIDGRRIGESLYVSLLSPDRRRACVDAFLPTSEDAQPLVGFVGDTLLVLEQWLAGQRVTTSIKRFTIAPDRCSWLPTDRAVTVGGGD